MGKNFDRVEYVVGCSQDLSLCDYEQIGVFQDALHGKCPKCGSPLKIKRMPGQEDYDRLRPSKTVRFHDPPKAEDGDEIILEIE